MKSTGRTILVALVGALVLCAVASASASASMPEFVPGEGAKFPIAFTGKESHNAFWEGSGGGWFDCGSITTKGELTGAKTASLTLEWTGCSEGSSGLKFYTKGEPAGTVVIPGSGTLVYMSKAAKEVGLLFTLKEAVKVYGNGNQEGSVYFRLSGSVLIPLAPINTKLTKLDLPFEGGKSPGEPKYSKYENEKGEAERASFVIKSVGGGEGEGNLQIGGADAVTAGSALTIAG